MTKVNIVFEVPTNRDVFFIKKYLKRNIPVWIVEPFYAYHHKKRGTGFSPSAYLPSGIEDLIQRAKINILTVDELKADEIIFHSTDKAVEIIENVSIQYRKEYGELFQYVTDTLKSPMAEYVFKKILCDKLAVFYSANIMFHRIEKLLNFEPIYVYPNINVKNYLFLRKLLAKSDQEFYEHPNIHFPVQTYVSAFIGSFNQYMVAILRLFFQTVASGLLSGFCSYKGKSKKNYTYGVTILVPTRQLTLDQRGPDFLIDNSKICAEEVVYFPLAELTIDQKKKLAKLPGTIYYPPKVGSYFSNFTEWKKLLWLTLRKKYLRNGKDISSICNVFFNYFSWLRIMDRVSIRHLITHSDFGVSHIGRNLALCQAGVETWYYTDSMNNGCNWKRKNGQDGVRHPFWTYLLYDHLVTWSPLLVQYFKEHPGSFKHSHVVGCLWSDHTKKNNLNGHILDSINENIKRKFIIAAFDTTYSMNCITSYAEGVAFAKHLLELANACPDIYIFLKEKKEREFHQTLDPFHGPELLHLYNKMDSHPRISIFSNQADASELISVSDVVVSFPFTSTTFEALSVNKPAIWHDPLGYYKNTPYGKIKNVTTHCYEEMKARVLEFKETKPNGFQNPIPENSPLIDPYSDGKAIDRFRDLLVNK